MNGKIVVNGAEITVTTIEDKDYISLTDMLKAKDGDFFISDWLRNRNTVEFLGIWEQIHNPNFNYGEFATIRSQAGLNSYKLSVKEWAEKLMQLVSEPKPGGTAGHTHIRTSPSSSACGSAPNSKSTSLKSLSGSRPRR